MTRLKPIDPNQLQTRERAVYDSIAGMRGAVRGPFLALLHSPELASRVEQLGVYVRYESAVPERLRELAILVVARHWRADYEWLIHASLAQGQGLDARHLMKLGTGDMPDWDTPADSLTHVFCAGLLREGEVDDETYGHMTKLLGPQGVVDLVGLVGYYALLALTLNAHAVIVPEGSAIPWRQELAKTPDV
jgi:4-carboxymuconolactone decarboxylase